MVRASALAILAGTVLATPVMGAEYWVVWRQGQICHVAGVPVKPVVRQIYPEDISKGHKDEKAGCTAAKNLKTDGENPTAKLCFTYSTESASSCRALGVVVAR